MEEVLPSELNWNQHVCKTSELCNLIFPYLCQVTAAASYLEFKSVLDEKEKV